MAKRATFSNGHTDTYKGKRQVTAAWMVVLPSGEIVSGHSLDRKRAEGTARSTASGRGGNYLLSLTNGRNKSHVGVIAYIAGEARKVGLSSKDYIAKLQAERDAFVASCTIEIVDLEG